MLQERERLLYLIKTRAFKTGDFTLSSGKKSGYYLNGKIITLDAEGAFLIAKILLKLLPIGELDAFGGLTLGADPIVGAMTALSYEQGSPINGFIIRKAAKGHGTAALYEGPPLPAKAKVVVVEDVVTTGGSAFKAIEVLEEMGAEVKYVVCVVDRQEGGQEAFEKKGLQFISIFNKDEILDSLTR